MSGKQVCIIEDVVTTGGAIIDGLHERFKPGGVIDNVICVIQRNPKATDIFSGAWVETDSGIYGG